MTLQPKHAAQDPDEWDRHWAQLNEVTELNPAQLYRHRLLVALVSDLIHDHPEVHTVIDLGSGQGDFLSMLVPLFDERQFFGFELSRVGVEISQRKLAAARFFQHNMLLDAPEIPELRNRGDLCVCSEVLEHLDDPRIFLQNARRYMADRGFLIVTVPSGPMNAFERSIGHRQHFTRTSIASLIGSAGFEVLAVRQAGFPFFNLYKLAGVIRGDKVRTDAERMGTSSPSRSLRLALQTFAVLFNFNLSNTPYGWQLVAVARKRLEGQPS